MGSDLNQQRSSNSQKRFIASMTSRLPFSSSSLSVHQTNDNNNDNSRTSIPPRLSASAGPPSSGIKTSTEPPNSSSNSNSYSKLLLKSHLISARQTLTSKIQSLSQTQQGIKYAAVLSRSDAVTGELHGVQPNSQPEEVGGGRVLDGENEEEGEGSSRPKGRRGPAGPDMLMRRFWAERLWNRRWREDEEVSRCLERVNARLGLEAVGRNRKRKRIVDEWEEDPDPSDDRDEDSEHQSRLLPPLPEIEHIIPLIPPTGITPKALATYFYPAIRNYPARRSAFTSLLRDCWKSQTGFGVVVDEKTGVLRKNSGNGERDKKEEEGRKKEKKREVHAAAAAAARRTGSWLQTRGREDRILVQQRAAAAAAVPQNDDGGWTTSYLERIAREALKILEEEGFRADHRGE